MINKIPTALEILEKNFYNKFDDTDKKTFIKAIIEFTGIHIKEALKVASEKTILEKKKIDYTGVRSGDFYVVEVIDKNSILNAYPLTNIK